MGNESKFNPDSQRQLEDLFQRRQSGVKFSLKRMRKLCADLGHPEADLRFIHIAGTNGKGSVAAMCAAILKAAGIRSGLYTSPHLIRYHERFRVDEQEIRSEELETSLQQVMPLAKGATFFEISTGLALHWFRQRGVEIAVWETGLGGRLDATNVVTPLATVLTSIGRDHMNFLGNTLEEIAREKAGIIKPFVPVVSSPQEERVLAVLEAVAGELNAPFHRVTESVLGEFQPPLAGEHQRWNTALAALAIRQACPGIAAETIRKGLERTKWPGRCQLFERKGGPTVLLDGAHNPMGIGVLMREIERRWGRGKVTLIFGVLADKSVPEMAEALREAAAEVFLVPVSSERSAAVSAVSPYFPASREFSTLQSALSAADSAQRPIVITGSLFLVGEALLFLSGQERRLHPNEQFSV